MRRRAEATQPSDDFAPIADQVGNATLGSDLFGAPESHTVEQARQRFRAMATALHPDRVDAARTSAATIAFSRLNDLWNEWLVLAGRRVERSTVTTAIHRYELGARRYSGAICDLFDGRYVDDDGEHAVLVKLVRSPRDNDLLETERRALELLERGEERFRPYVPRLVDSFVHRDLESAAERRASVLARLDGFVTLDEVRAAHPDGLDARDAAWMWRRLLVALGFLHRNGVVHGAVLPEHVLIHPELHGLVVLDFCYSAVAPGDRLVAIPPTRRRWYPPEVVTTKRAEPSLDIYLASRLMLWLMGTQTPGPLRRLLDGCVLGADRLRPTNAWRLLDELDAVLGDLYGPRRFRPFTMPPSSSGT